jgi:2-keto-4-pentenoate hydratase/2-oxohepta-3-ene-1,7-dioic acid hydratase in catechol pathway
MKLLRFKQDNIEKSGVLYDEGIKELSCSITDALKSSNIDEFLKDEKIHDVDKVKILPPVKPSKVICIGLNYRDHARELNMEIQMNQ